MEQTRRLLSHHLKFGESYRSMENMAKIMNSTPSASINVPTTKHEIKKLMPSVLAAQFHIKCSNCSNYLASATSNVNCCRCKVLIKSIDTDYLNG